MEVVLELGSVPMPDKTFKPSAKPLNIEYLSTRFWRKVAIGPEDECWLWQQSTGSHGYGQTWDSVTVRLAHRVAWELTNGPIPQGITVDHICRVRRCCNPSHLRLLTNLDNATDNGQGRKTHCPRGHEYTEENTYRQPSHPGWRKCRACIKKQF